MRKRLTCLIMAVSILLSVIAASPTSARAVSEMTLSEDAIAFLKNWEGFHAKPYWDHSQWTVGYGTRCPDEDLERYNAEGITEEEALTLLAKELAFFESEVNAFIDRHNLTYSQNQFDAIVSLVFNCGSSWLTKGDTLIAAITNDVSDNELIFALTIYSMSSGERSKGHIFRRLTECNIYLNGVYQVAVPANYRYVLYDACGGTVVEYNVQGFDANQPTQLFTTATYEGYKFLGWYTEETGGTKVELLDDSIPTGKWLYAHWESLTPEATDPTQPTEPPTQPTEPPTQPTEPPTQPTEPPTQPTEPPTQPTEPPTQPTEPPTQTTEPPTQPTEPPTQPTQPPTQPTEPPTQPTEPPTQPTQPPTQPTQPPTQPTEPVSPPITPEPGTGTVVTVTGTDVNIRTGPGTSYSISGKANAGQKLTITATASANGYLWGQFSGGWICLDFTDYEEVKNKPISTGTVIAEGTLNIRANPGTAYEIVGQYNSGDRVNIYETKAIGTVTWGRTEKGWISLDYVRLDSADSPDNPPAETPAETWSGTVTVNDYLWIRSGAGTQYDAVGKLAGGSRVTILERKTVNGTQWGRIAQGWICMDYVTLDSDENSGGTSAYQPWTGTVQVDDLLHIRSGPSPDTSIVGYLLKGASVTILEEKTVAGTRWGRIEKGWICLDYVKSDSQSGGNNPTPDPTVPPETTTPTLPPETTQPTEPGFVSKTMTVNTTSLRLRSGAGITYKIIDYLTFGQRIEILEIQTIGSTQWGRTANGWVNMRYLK